MLDPQTIESISMSKRKSYGSPYKNVAYFDWRQKQNEQVSPATKSKQKQRTIPASVDIMHQFAFETSKSTATSGRYIPIIEIDYA